jgi:hypothetical protein
MFLDRQGENFLDPADCGGITSVLSQISMEINAA